MTLSSAVRRAGKIVADNSPALLTAVGVAGVVTTAYLTGKATFKAALILEENELRDDPLEVKEKVQLVWKSYIPAALMGTATIFAIIAANRVGSRRAVALAAAYSLSERAFEEYRSKIIEKIGEKKEREARDELAQDRVSRAAGTREIIVTGNGSVLCYEAFTGRYFLSDMETLRKAENDINHQVLHDSFASLSDLYDQIGLSHTSFSDEVGWNMDKLLELQFSTTLSESGKPCVVVDFKVGPIRHYNRLM